MNHTRPMCCSTVCVCVYLLNVYPMALQNSTVTPKVFWYERMLYRKTNCSLQCIHSVVGFEYFIFRWFVKIILIAMRLDGNRKWRWCVSESRIEVERRWEEWKKKTRENHHDAIHSHEYANGYDFEKRIRFKCDRNTMMANRKSTIAIDFKKKHTSIYSIDLLLIPFCVLLVCFHIDGGER